jgi:hypothetical protein
MIHTDTTTLICWSCSSAPMYKQCSTTKHSIVLSWDKTLRSILTALPKITRICFESTGRDGGRRSTRSTAAIFKGTYGARQADRRWHMTRAGSVAAVSSPAQRIHSRERRSGKGGVRGSGLSSLSIWSEGCWDVQHG